MVATEANWESIPIQMGQPLLKPSSLLPCSNIHPIADLPIFQTLLKIRIFI